MAGHGAEEPTRKIGRLFRRRLLAAALEFSSYRRDLGFAALVRRVRAAARFHRASHSLQERTGGAVCGFLRDHRVGAEFSSPRLREFFPGTSIRHGHAELRTMV